jgi:hypothetical protein
MLVFDLQGAVYLPNGTFIDSEGELQRTRFTPAPAQAPVPIDEESTDDRWGGRNRNFVGYQPRPPYPAPERTAEDLQQHRLAILAHTVREARVAVRNYFLQPLKEVLLPTMLSCTTAAEILKVGREYPSMYVGNKWAMVLALMDKDFDTYSELLERTKTLDAEEMAR